VSPRLNDNHNY